MEVIIQPTAEAAALLVAKLIAKELRGNPYLVLGLATGGTMERVYGQLARMHREEGLSFRRVVSFNLDEYYPMPPDNIHSYHRFMWENLFAHVDADRKKVHIPDGTVPRGKLDAWCAGYERAIAQAGGIAGPSSWSGNVRADCGLSGAEG